MRKYPDVTHRHSRWTLKSPLPLSASVEEHLNALLSALEPNAEGIRAIQSRFPTHIGCAVYFQTHNPGFQLSATVTMVTISNSPKIVARVKLGDRIEIPPADITDWNYMRDGKYVGIFTMPPRFKYMPAADGGVQTSED
jgi:hypothetical protein